MCAAMWFTAIATGILAIFAVVTAWYARRAFREQSDEVRTLKAQLEDQEGLTANQTSVLELQAKELQESIEERRRDRAEKERRQAIQVAAWMLVEQEDERERHDADLDDFFSI
jgi:ABC-type multidrug transport system fused ATPase/permease subunit